MKNPEVFAYYCPKCGHLYVFEKKIVDNRCTNDRCWWGLLSGGEKPPVLKPFALTHYDGSPRFVTTVEAA